MADFDLYALTKCCRPQLSFLQRQQAFASAKELLAKGRTGGILAYDAMNLMMNLHCARKTLADIGTTEAELMSMVRLPVREIA